MRSVPANSIHRSTRGHATTVIVMSGYGAFTFFALGVYIFAGLFLFVSYYLRGKIRRLMSSALVAKGTVIAIESDVSMSSDSVDKVFHPVFEFRDVQGVEYRVRSAAGTNPATHKVGDVVEVFYPAHSPHAGIIDPKGYIQMARIFFFAGIAAVVVATIIMVLESK